MSPKLAWINELVGSLSVATGIGVIARVEDTVDPLKKLVILDLGDSELGKGDWNPMQNLIHGFAKANDCVVHKIKRHKGQLSLEILTKSRLGPESRKNPLSGDKG
jgi:hypothetical protein